MHVSPWILIAEGTSRSENYRYPLLISSIVNFGGKICILGPVSCNVSLFFRLNTPTDPSPISSRLDVELTWKGNRRRLLLRFWIEYLRTVSKNAFNFTKLRIVFTECRLFETQKLDAGPSRGRHQIVFGLRQFFLRPRRPSFSLQSVRWMTNFEKQLQTRGRGRIPLLRLLAPVFLLFFT